MNKNKSQLGANARLAGKRRRRGSTTVEFAMTVPLVFLILFAGVEFSRAMVVRNGVQSAAMAGARAGIVPGAKLVDCQNAANNMLETAMIRDATVIVEPAAGITSATENVTVTVTASMDSNSLPLGKYLIGAEMMQTITLRRENHAESGN